MDYVKTPAVKHTSNQWQKSEYGYYEISNMVYKMSYRIREDISYHRGVKQPPVWYVSWTVSVNEPQRKGYYRTSASIIAGQEQKRYTDKAAAEKYVQGRFDAYSHLFTELSPPIPEDKLQFFTVNGHLLPGYSVQPHEPTAQELLDFLDDKDFSSTAAAPAPAEKTPDKKPAKTGKAPAKKRNDAPSR